MNDPVFLDSGIFIAFLNTSDRWHSQARDLFGGSKPRWSTSYLVVSETYSWFLHRYGEEDARTFRLLIDRLDGLRIFEATADHHQDVAKMLDRLRGTKLTTRRGVLIDRWWPSSLSCPRPELSRA